MDEHYLNGAKWSLKNKNYEYEGTLDKNGKADLRNIALGDYIFTLSKKGYITKEEVVSIGLNNNDIKVNLEKKPIKKPKSKKVAKPVKEETTEEANEETPKKETKKTTKKGSKRKTRKSGKKSTKTDEETKTEEKSVEDKEKN